MGEFLPLRVKLLDGRALLVSSLPDVDAALKGQWKNPNSHAFKEAIRLLVAAKKGECRPSIAFAAFSVPAHQQGLMQPERPSAALGILDKMASSLKA